MEAYAGVKNDRYRLWIVSHVMGQSAVRLNPPLLSHDAWARGSERRLGRLAVLTDVGVWNKMKWDVVKESEGVRRLWTERQWCTMYRKARSQVRSHRCSEFWLIEDLFEGNKSLVAGQVTSLAEGLLKFPSGQR